MNTMTENTWIEANQCYLNAALSIVRGYLESGVVTANDADNLVDVDEYTDDTEGTLAQAETSILESLATDMEAPPALEVLCAVFGLSQFERDLILLCAGIELNTGFAETIAGIQGYSGHKPSFSLAMSLLPNAHWSALTPVAPLRRWRLVEIDPREGLARRHLSIDERILHYLTGISYQDTRLTGLISPVLEAPLLAPSQVMIAEQVELTWSSSLDEEAPVVQLHGHHNAEKRGIAVQACLVLGLTLYELNSADIPADYAEREALARLWERESALDQTALLLNCQDTSNNHVTAAFLNEMHGLCFLNSEEAIDIGPRFSIHLEATRPTALEQKHLWQLALGEKAEKLNGQFDQLISQFNLGLDVINSTACEIQEKFPEADTEELNNALWQACRVKSRQRLDKLTQRIEPMADWEELILPEQQKKTLQEITIQVRQRFKVYETWGFAKKSSRGLGISALFTGSSGTGKTMAAEVLANELQLDLYCIDLSQVVSKYIGETEKNLRRLFNAADDSGAILLFDEADALFGKRSEVKDSHDRYANIEVSYLLQRIESYRGLAILTTNQRKALDSAFLRRIRFIVEFPFPDSTLRGEIWKSILPAEVPTDELIIERLSRLNVAGGDIRNIALNAAFLAADAGESLNMEHLLRATKGEFAKLEKPLTGTEVKGWI